MYSFSLSYTYGFLNAESQIQTSLAVTKSATLAVLRFGQLTSSWKFATASSQAVLLLRVSLLAKNRMVLLDLLKVCPVDLVLKKSDRLRFLLNPPCFGLGRCDHLYHTRAKHTNTEPDLLWKSSLNRESNPMPVEDSVKHPEKQEGGSSMQ